MITQFFYLGNVSRALKTKIYTFTQFYYGIVKKYQKPKEYKKQKLDDFSLGLSKSMKKKQNLHDFTLGLSKRDFTLGLYISTDDKLDVPSSPPIT